MENNIPNDMWPIFDMFMVDFQLKTFIYSVMMNDNTKEVWRDLIHQYPHFNVLNTYTDVAENLIQAHTSESTNRNRRSGTWIVMDSPNISAMYTRANRDHQIIHEPNNLNDNENDHGTSMEDIDY